MDKAKKIVFIGFDVESTGGISTYSRYQIKALRSQYNNIKVYTLDQFEKSYKGYSDISLRYNTKLVLARLMITLLLRERNADLIVFNHVNLSFLGAILNKICKIKYVVFGYNTDILIYLKGLYEFGLKNSEALVIDCKYTIDRLNEFHEIIPTTYLLYDPIDMDFFKPINKIKSRKYLADKYNIDFSNKFVITTVALMRETANKGHRLIVDSIEKINNKNILYLITSGGGDKKNIEKYVEDKGLKDQVIFFGYVESVLIPYFYNSSDMVALISKDGYGKGEGVPLGLMEASSCEVPILAGVEDGSYEAISDKHQNGFRVNPRDTGEIAEKIQFYIDNPGVRKQHGKNGRKFVMEEFEYGKFRDKHNKIIDEILNV